MAEEQNNCKIKLFEQRNWGTREILQIALYLLLVTDVEIRNVASVLLFQMWQVIKSERLGGSPALHNNNFLEKFTCRKEKPHERWLNK